MHDSVSGTGVRLSASSSTWQRHPADAQLRTDRFAAIAACHTGPWLGAGPASAYLSGACQRRALFDERDADQRAHRLDDRLCLHSLGLPGDLRPDHSSRRFDLITGAKRGVAGKCRGSQVRQSTALCNRSVAEKSAQVVATALAMKLVEISGLEATMYATVQTVPCYAPSLSFRLLCRHRSRQVDMSRDASWTALPVAWRKQAADRNWKRGRPSVNAEQ